MSMIPREADSEEIKSVIESDTIKKYHHHIKEKLSIQESKHEILTRDLARDKDGYVKDDVNASVVTNNQYKDYNIEFYYDNIQRNTKKMFSKIHDKEVFNEAVNVAIKYALIHELTHVKQIMSGIDMNSESHIEYSKRKIEIEANETALEILSNESRFAASIADFIFTKKPVHVDSVPYLKTLLEENNCQ